MMQNPKSKIQNPKSKIQNPMKNIDFFLSICVSSTMQNILYIRSSKSCICQKLYYLLKEFPNLQPEVVKKLLMDATYKIVGRILELHAKTGVFIYNNTIINHADVVFIHSIMRRDDKNLSHDTTKKCQMILNCNKTLPEMREMFLRHITFHGLVYTFIKYEGCKFLLDGLVEQKVCNITQLVSNNIADVTVTTNTINGVDFTFTVPREILVFDMINEYKEYISSLIQWINDVHLNDATIFNYKKLIEKKIMQFPSEVFMTSSDGLQRIIELFIEAKGYEFGTKRNVVVA